LKKSLYVLKKSPRAWFDRINEPFSVWVTKNVMGVILCSIGIQKVISQSPQFTWMIVLSRQMIMWR
jgi:hypothetical protein